MPHQGNVQEATTGVSGQGAGNARCYALRLKAQCVTNSARRANHFPIYGKHVKPLTQKYSAFQNTQISGTSRCVPDRPRDVAHRHDTLGRDAMDAVVSGAVCRVRRDIRSVRRSRVVLAPRPWRQSTPVFFGVATVARTAAHRGEHEISRQTIARGKPV